MEKTRRHRRQIVALLITSIALVSVITMMHLRNKPRIQDADLKKDFTYLPTNDSTKASINESYGRIPLSFEANNGQTDSNVQFLLRASQYNLFLTQAEAVFTLCCLDEHNNQVDSSADSPRRSVLRMTFDNSNPRSSLEGVDEQERKVNYIIGKNRDRWRNRIPTYSRVKRRDVYPGIDVIYYSKNRQLEYDIIVSPGADPSAIKISFNGVEKLELESGGDLILQTASGHLRHERPIIYQVVGGVMKKIEGEYELKDNKSIGFKVSTYDTTIPLVIDPVLTYSTYIHAAAGYSIAVDEYGNAYLTGGTSALDFPTVNPIQPNLSGGQDIFIAKLNPAGNAIVYSTYLGGSGSDVFGSPSIALDSTGNAYVTGGTFSDDFPTVNAFQSSIQGGECGNFDHCPEAFVVKLNSSGSALIYSTYLGGSRHEHGLGIAVSSSGNAYVTGDTISYDFPLANALQTTYQDGEAFITKFDPLGGMVFSTYLGGSGGDSGSGIALDSSENIYSAGVTTSTDFPTTPGSIQPAGPGNIYLAKLDSSGSTIQYSTYLDGIRSVTGLAADNWGNAILTGRTFGGLTTVNPFQPTYGGAFCTGCEPSGDGYITKVNAAGSAFVYSTYLGGSHDDTPHAIAVDSSGNVYVTGATGSADFPVMNPIQSSLTHIEAFVTKISPTGTLIYSTYLGGSGSDSGEGIAVDSVGSAYISGGVNSVDFPTMNPLQANLSSGSDGFVAKISDQPPNQPPTIVCPTMVTTEAITQSGSNMTLSAAVNDADGDSLTVTWLVDNIIVLVDNIPSPTTSTNSQLNYTFSLGTHTVTVSIDDGHGPSVSCSIGMNVVDTTMPSISCPTDVTVIAPISQRTTHVSYPSPTANDSGSVPSIICSIASGSNFPIGVSSVSCTATDSSGNQSSCSFKVAVSGTLIVERDSFLRNGSDHTNEGATERLRVRSSGHNRSLVWFDLSNIPTQHLQSATLVLNIAEPATSWGTTGRIVDAHRLLIDWAEGNGRNTIFVGGGPTIRGTGLGVTWNCATDTNINNHSADCGFDWNGGLFAQTTSAGSLHTNNMTGDVFWNVTNDVFAGANYGWIIKKREEGQNGLVEYYSREGAILIGNPNVSARLVLVYAP